MDAASVTQFLEVETMERLQRGFRSGLSLATSPGALQSHQHIRGGRPVAVAMTDLAKEDVVVSIDQEGGRISRLMRRVPAQTILVGDPVVGIDDQMDIV